MNQETLLTASHITRRFGGLTAINDVSLSLTRGAVHAVIGTNGAGKSTLVSVLSGELPPNEGRITLGSNDITHWPQPRRAQAGMGRSYQRTTIFPSLTVHENCRIAAQANHQHFWRWLQAARRCSESNNAADRALELAGLQDEASRTAGLLSHGAKRQLEIAMSLATQPQVLLLDEPLAGMGPEETGRMLDLLDALKQDHAILLIEHDMDAVFRIADVITVMVNGSVIAHGDPEAIRTDPQVQIAYLGDGE
jgi:branched-chain amino acid transport system ATP-binding protein